MFCWTYEYNIDDEKLHHFPSTLKYLDLDGFMGLEGGSIHNWDQRKWVFSMEYHDYYRAWGTRDENFGLSQWANESLEDYVECF